jgi:hypothetical protein
MAPKESDEGKEPADDGESGESTNLDNQSASDAPQEGEGTQASQADEVKEVLKEISDGADTGEDDGFYKLNKTQLYQEIRKIAAEDEDFDRRIREYAGRSNKRDYETKLAELEAERDGLARKLKAAEIAEMDDEAIDKKMAEDPEWAHDYVDILHPTEDDDIDDNQWRIIFETETEDQLDLAASLGMSDARADMFKQAWTYCAACKSNDHGFFDHDERGRFFDEQYPGEDAALGASLEYFKRTIQYDIQQLQSSNQDSTQSQPQEKTPAAEEQKVVEREPEKVPEAKAPAKDGSRRPVGILNEELASRSPDASRGEGGNQEPVKTYTAEEIREWPHDKRIEFFKQFKGGRQEAIATGIVRVKGLSEELGYK